MSENTDNNFITLSSYPKAIAHIDCDAFFASCEQAREPKLKGRPLVTGQERGIISCASYEAKRLGIKRGVRLFEAKRICPNLIIMPSDYETYSIYSKRMFSIIRKFTPMVEEYSIDEAFCDLTGLRRLYRKPYSEIAKDIKNAIQKELDITVSVGLSLTKTLSKIASEIYKPDAFFALPGNHLHKFLKKVPLEKVCGFGPSTVELLTKYGISNVFDYVNRPVGFAKKLLGKIGVELWGELRGIMTYKLSNEKKEKYISISKTKTFMPASEKRDYVRAHLMRNMESAFIKLRRHKLSAGVLSVYLRRNDFGGVFLEAGLNRHSSSTLDFTRICGQLFDLAFRDGTSYRATGVVLSKINAEGVDTRTLFDDPIKIDRINKLSRTVDEINSIFGKHTVHIATADNGILKKSQHSRSKTASRKEKLLKGETFRKRLGIPLLKLE